MFKVGIPGGNRARLSMARGVRTVMDSVVPRERIACRHSSPVQDGFLISEFGVSDLYRGKKYF